jgi:non-heme chloroperoxidase
MTSGTVTIDDVRLHYVESGRGPSVLFVPGWMATTDFWDLQIRHFARRFRAVAVDPRSQGESSKTDAGNCTIRRAMDLKSVIDRLALAPVVVVAWSMGVTDVLSALDQFGPSDFAALVLVDGPIVSLARSPKVWATFVEETEKMRRNRGEQNAALIRRFLKRPHPEELHRRLEAATLKTDTDTAIALLFDAQGFDFQRALRNSDVPAMFVGRSEDPGGQAAIFRTNRPADRVELRGDVGHALFLDDPDWFNDTLDGFLRSIVPIHPKAPVVGPAVGGPREHN